MSDRLSDAAALTVAMAGAAASDVVAALGPLRAARVGEGLAALRHGATSLERARSLAAAALHLGRAEFAAPRSALGPSLLRRWVASLPAASRSTLLESVDAPLRSGFATGAVPLDDDARRVAERVAASAFRLLRRALTVDEWSSVLAALAGRGGDAVGTRVARFVRMQPGGSDAVAFAERLVEA